MIKRKIRVKKNVFLYILIAPLMILTAFLGVTLRDDSKKSFYLPLGTVGFFMILDKEFKRRQSRKNILKKIQYFKSNK